MPRCIQKIVIIGLLLFIPLFGADALAGGGDQALLDSLLTKAAGEPSLQEILDSLGYSIDVVNDELSLTQLAAPLGSSIAVLKVEMSTSFGSAYAGWYDAADSTNKGQLFGPESHADDTTSFIVTGASNIGFYFIPGISGGYTWYTNPSYNRDLYDHAKVFATNVNPNEYIFAFEDLKNGGDQDFNDLIILVQFAQQPPTVQLPEDFYVNACAEKEICFDIDAYAGGPGDTITLEMVQGFGTFSTITAVDSIHASNCYLTGVSDIAHVFIFKVSDQDGNSSYDTLAVEFDVNAPPELYVPDDFDTLMCSSDEICFSVSSFDEDGDDVEFELLEGAGSIDPVTGEICFVPVQDETTAYKFIIQAKDSCCIEREGSCPEGQTCPYGCPIDSVTVTVTLIGGPTVSVPDLDTLLCEPTEVCFPIQIDSSGSVGVTIDVTPPATFNPGSGEVCIYADAEGTYDIVVSVGTELCGVTDVDTSTVTIDLNSPPVVELPNDTAYTLCEPEEICFTAIGSDPDNETISYTLEAGPGSINSQTGEVCFTPAGAGSYEFIVSVKDWCEAIDADTIIIDIMLNNPPQVYAPDTSLFLCELTEVCFTAEASDPDPGEVLVFALESGPGSINSETGEVCFTPASEGDYDFVVSVMDHCGLMAYDTATVSIQLNRDPVIQIDPADTLFWCELGDSVCFTIEYTDPDVGQAHTFEQISGYAGSLDPETGRFCFLPGAEGDFQFEFSVTDVCGASDTGSTMITIELNGVPVVTLPDDFADSLCAPADICFPVTIEDDGDVVVDVSPIGAYSNGQVCFTATKDTTYCITVRATDICDIYDEEVICVTVHMNEPPFISLGPNQELYYCEKPDSICFDVTVSDPDGTVPTVEFLTGSGTYADGQVCFEPDTAGTYLFIMKATDECGEHMTDDVFIVVDYNTPPEIQLANDTTYLLCGPEQICFDYSAFDADPDDDLTFELISGSGVLILESSRVCFTPPSAGSYRFILRVYDECEAYDQDTIDIGVEFNSPPTITGSDIAIEITYCTPDDVPTEQCFSAITVDDPDEADVLTVTQTCGPGTFNPATLTTCFTPELKDSIYEFCYRVEDLCGDYDEVVLNVDITATDICDTISCLTVTIEDTEECAYNNTNISLNIYADAQEGIGGFDMLVQYDVTGFTFLSAEIGPALAGWEYFTYRYLTDGDCGGGPCADGLIRLVGIADINDGGNHPPVSAFWPSGSIALLNFHVTDDVNFGGLFFPVNFYWFDCGDNGFSSIGGDSLFVDKLVLGQNRVVWDEFDDVNYPENDRLPNVGVPDDCLEGGKTSPLRCVIFQNGGICIISPDSIDARGDMNLNDVAYEIGDAVLYTNYFIYGGSVFTINPAGQIAASDVNADGNSLTVGDLVYMIRVLTGDAQPIPKLSPFADYIDIGLQPTEGAVVVSSESRATIGAGHFVFKYDPQAVTPGEPVLGTDADGMDMKYSIDNGEIRVLVYSFGQDQVNSGENSLFTIPVSGNGDLELVHSELADYDGNQLAVNQKQVVTVPSAFKLTQNYPNPFNPETEFDMFLPAASEWSVQILNVNGQTVRTISGFSGAGVVNVKWDARDDNGQKVASGIYFYRATAGEYSDIKKMMLIK